MHQKTVKFKDLPKRVQEFLKRVFDKDFPSSHEFDLDWLHTLPQWSKATDDERLAYAEWKYPKGIKIKRLIPDYETYIVFGRPRLVTYHHQNNWIFDGDGIGIYDPYINKWAEIIEEPEIDSNKDNIPVDDEPSALTKAKQALHDHIQSNPEKVRQDLDKMRALSNEFKAGDMVEWARPGAFGKLENSWSKEPVYYTGGIAKSGLYICQDEDGEIIYPSHIRKCDPDKHLREIAKEIMRHGDLFEYKTIKYTFTNLSMNEIESMLIEALKKGKNL